MLLISIEQSEIIGYILNIVDNTDDVICKNVVHKDKWVEWKGKNGG